MPVNSKHLDGKEQVHPDPADLLTQVPLFTGLCAEELRDIGAHAVLKSYRKHTVVVEKGDESSSLYVLVSGKVKVYVADEEGKELVLTVLDSHAHFGELALLGETPRTASVMTLEDSRFLLISKSDFIACLSGHPDVAFHIIQHLVERVRLLTERVAALGLMDVYGRVVAELRERAREENGRLITGRLTQQELAQVVGSSREMVSRIFKELRQGGYIEIEHKRIIINRPLPDRW